MVKIKVYDLKGQKGKEIEKPKVLSGKIREDIVAKVIEAKKIDDGFEVKTDKGNIYQSKTLFIAWTILSILLSFFQRSLSRSSRFSLNHFLPLLFFIKTLNWL